MKKTDGVTILVINAVVLVNNLNHFQAAFHDQAPYLLMSEESIADLNSRLPDDDQVSILNFRPTIAVSGCSAFEEDTWTFIRIGDTATFRLMKRCDR